MAIRTGTGSAPDGEKYNWASFDGWRVVHYPFAGGTEFYASGPSGWVVDVHDDMPEAISRTLCRFAGVHADVIEIIHDGEPLPCN